MHVWQDVVHHRADQTLNFEGICHAMSEENGVAPLHRSSTVSASRSVDTPVQVGHLYSRPLRSTERRIRRVVAASSIRVGLLA